MVPVNRFSKSPDPQSLKQTEITCIAGSQSFEIFRTPLGVLDVVSTEGKASL